MKRAMNRKKRLDAPSKQEARERYETARRESGDAKSGQDNVSGSEGFKRPREDSDKQSSDLRDKIPKLSRTIEVNDKTGSVVNVEKDTGAKSLVDPSYGDRSGVETFDYSHRLGDNVPLEGDSDDLRSLIDKQRKTSQSEKDSTKESKKGSIVYDSKYVKDEHSNGKRKDTRKSSSSLGRNDKSKGSRHSDESMRKKQGSTGSPSGYELGKPFFSGGAKSDKKKSKPEEMDIEETLKELAYLRSIQTGENALPKEEEEYFLKMNDLSKASSSINLDSLLTGGNTTKKKQEKSKGSTDLNQSASKWEKVIDIVSGKASSKTDSVDDGTYGPSLPPKAPAPKPSTSTSKNSNSSSKSSSKEFPIAVRGARGGRGRGIRGRGRGRGRGFDEGFARGRGRARGGRGGRGSLTLRGRHIFTNKSSRSSSKSSRSSSSSRSRSRRNRSRSGSRGRGSTKKRRSSSGSSSSSSSHSRSRSRSRSKKSRPTSDQNRSRSSSQRHSKERQRSRSSSRSQSRKRKDRSRSWSFDEVYTNSKNGKNKEKSKQANKPQEKLPDKALCSKTAGNNNKKTESKSEDKRMKGKDTEKPSKEKLKLDQAAAGAGVFLPRTVTKTMSKSMQLPKGGGLSIKTHPVFAAQDKLEEETPKPKSPKEREEDRERKHEFAKEIDKVFNAKPWPEEKKAIGKWMPVLSVEEQKEREKAHERKNAETDIQDKIEVEMEIEGTKDIFDDKSKDGDKKERKEKKRKEKEEKNKRKKEKKEKKEKKKKEKELEASETGNAANIEDSQGTFNNQDIQGEAYTEYSQEYQEYPDDGYDEAYQQGWYDENGEFHHNEEGEYYYYYDAEGNIVGYEGPEGYIEGNPFEGQEYAADGQGEGWQGNQEYPGGYEAGEGQYEYQGQDQEMYFTEEQYQEQDDAGQWESYQGEQQWYGAEGAYPEVAEPLTEDQYLQEGHNYQQQANAVDPNLINQNYGHQPLAAEVVEEPVVSQELPNASADTQSFLTELAAKANPSLMLEMAARGIGEKELISFLGAQLKQFARVQGLPYQEPVKAEAEPIQAPLDLGPPKPVVPLEHSLQREDAQQKPLKSILKKGNPVSLKPPTKENSPKASAPDISTTSSANQLVGQECIVRMSEHGMERFFCKLCKCNLESLVAKDLHVKSMKHIELFVREKSSLLQSVIGRAPTEKESITSGRDLVESGNVRDEIDIEHKKTWEDKDELGQGDCQEARESADRYGKSSDDDRDRVGVVDYDRLRLREWTLRESSGNVGNEKESEQITRDYGHGKPSRDESTQPRDYQDYDYHYDYRRESDDYGRTTYDNMSRARYSDRQDQDEYSDYERRRPYPMEDHHRYSERLSRDYENERQTRRRSPDRESDSSRRSVVSMSIEDSEHEYREFFEYSGQYPPYDEERELDRRSHSKEREYWNSQRDSQRQEDSRVRDVPYQDITGSSDQNENSREVQQQTRQRDISHEGSSQPQCLMDLGKLQKRKTPPKQFERGQASSSNQDNSNGTSLNNTSDPPKHSQNERQEPGNQQQRQELSDKANNKSATTNQHQNTAPSRSERPLSADRNNQKQSNQDQKKSRSTQQTLSIQGAGKSSSHQEKKKVQQTQTSKNNSTDQSKLPTTNNKTNISQQRQKTSQPSLQRPLSSAQKPSEKTKIQSKPEQKPNVTQKSKEETPKITEKRAPPSSKTSILGPAPGQLITTVTSGQSNVKGKRVPPPPPPYSTYSGVKSDIGRGHSPRGRGGNTNQGNVGRGYSQNPGNHSGGKISGSSLSASVGIASPQSRGPPLIGRVQQPSLRRLPQMGGFPQTNRGPQMGGHLTTNNPHHRNRNPHHIGSQPLPNSGSLHMGRSHPPSHGPQQMKAYSPPQGATGQPTAGSYSGNLGRGQLSSCGRGGGSRMQGSPQFAGRARGGRGYPQRW